MVYMYHSFLIYSSADGHLGCFHVLAIINSAALFKIARTWKQCRCPSTDEDKDDVVQVYNGILLSHKRNTFGSVQVTWMHIEPVYRVKEVREKELLYIINTYIWNLEKWY